MANNRIAALDYAKGFAIIMLLLTHCIPDGYVETWAFAWHMPIFFVICGMLHNMRHPVGLPYKQMWKWLKRRSEQIFIPYFLFGVLYAVFLSGLSVIGGGTSGFTDYCFALVTMQGVTSMWFLPVFFFAELFYTFFLMKLPRCVQAFGLVIAIAGLMYIKQAGVPEMWWVRILLKILVGLVFVVAGGFFVRERRLPPPHGEMDGHSGSRPGHRSGFVQWQCRDWCTKIGMCAFVRNYRYNVVVCNHQCV